MAQTTQKPPSVRKRFALVSLAAVVFVAGAVLVGSSVLERSDGTRSCTTGTAPRIGAGPGEVARYDLQYRAEICSGDECTGLLELSGSLEARVRDGLSGRDQVVDVQVASRTVEGEVSKRLPSPRSLSTPIRVSLSPHGAVTDIRYERQVDEPTQRLLESLVRELQVPNPECAEVRRGRWSGVEELVTASVMSEFQANAAKTEISWKRSRVLAWKDASDLFPLRARSSELALSEHRVALDGNRHVVRLTGKDEFVMQGVAVGPEMRLRVSVVLARDTSSAVASRFRPVAPPASNATGFVTASAYSEPADEERIAGRDVPSILSDLVRAREVKGEKGPTESRLFIAASALFRRDLAAAEKAADMVREQHPEREFLASALGHAGTAETASLLATLLKEASSSEMKRTVLGALGRATVVSPDVVGAMTAQFSDASVGGPARLMTGALAYRSRDASPESSDSAVQALVTDYSSQKDVRLRSDTLRGLGNAGSTASLGVSRLAVSSSIPMERAAGAESLRRVPSDSADRLLAGLMEDPEDSVRRSALTAALYRDPTERLATAVSRVARLDTASSVRREAIRVLVRWKDESAPARDTLAWIAVNDSEQELKNVAVEGLNRFSN